MGQQVGAGAFGLAGNLIGGFLGGPVGAAIGGMAGGIIGSLIFNRSKKPLITDVQLANSTYGNPIPILYGTSRLPGIMIWQTKIRTSSKALGKGGGQAAYHYHQSAAFAFCEGPAKIRKIWLDGKLFWDASNPKQELAKHTFQMRGYEGGEDQLPDPLIAQWVAENVAGAPDSCPAYRGLCYLVCEGVDLVNYGNRFPQITAECTATGQRDFYVNRLVPLPADVTTWHDPFGFEYNRTMAVDWASQLTWMMGSDGTLRAFSITSSQQLAAIAFADYAPTIVPPVWAPGWTQPEFPIDSGVAAAQGSRYIYVYGSLLPASMSYWIRALDRNTLKPVAGVSTLSDEPYWFIHPAPGQVGQLRVKDIIGPDGTKECLLGVGGYGNVFMIPVLEGGDLETAQWVKMHFENLTDYTSIVGGDDDVLADGSQYVYFLNTSFYGTGGGCYVFRATLTGFDIFDTTLLGVLMPSTFGFSDSNPAFFPCTGWFDSTDGTLIVSLRSGAIFDPPIPGDFVAKISPGKLAAGENPVIWQNVVPGAGISEWGTYQEATGVSLGTIAFSSGGQVSLMSTATGQYTAMSEATTTLSGVDMVLPVAYNAATQALLLTYVTSPDTHTPPAVVYLNYINAPAVSVGAIIADLCARVGLSSDMVDTSAVTDTCAGYVVRDMRSAGSAIADLCHTFLLDQVETDYELRFVPRGRAAVATLAYTDLLPPDAANPGHYWQARTAQEQEMPLEIVVKFNDPALDYQPGSTYAKRTALPVPTMFARRRQVVDLPVIVDNETARHIAEKWLYTMWAERQTYQSGLSAAWLWLDPGDNITVTLPDQTLTVRIEQVAIGADLSLHLTLAAEDISTYVASSSAGALTGAGAQTLTPAAYALLLNFNVPLLRDVDATAGTAGRVYFAAGAQNVASFSAGTVYRSTDAVNWPTEGTLAAAASWGRTLTVLADTQTPFATDYRNTVTVTLNPGSTAPVSCSYADLMNNANAALIGQEVIQYQTVTDNADGSFTLSTLLRGRRGTDWATNTHSVAETVVLLDLTTVGTGTLDLTDINRAEYWKLTGPSDSLASVTTQGWTYLGYDLMPYAPVYVIGVYSGSNIVLTWHRRTRIGGLLVDGSDTVPLSETSEAYEVEVLKAGAVVRTFAGLSSPTVTYTAGQIASDWTSPPTVLQVRVYQVSSVVGRGFSKTWTLDLSGIELAEADDPPPVAVV
jgi:hypothetical protein